MSHWYEHTWGMCKTTVDILRGKEGLAIQVLFIVLFPYVLAAACGWWIAAFLAASWDILRGE